MAGPNSLLRFLQMSDWSVEDVRLFLERDPSSINEPDDVDTPLFYLLKSPKCSRDIVALLLEFGASTDTRNIYGATPLLYAVEYVKDHDVINVLIGKTSNVNVRDNMGYSILCHALNFNLPIKLIENVLMKAGSVQACFVHATVFQCFLDDCGWRSTKYKTNEFAAVLKLLIQAGFDVIKVDPPDGRSPLCLALLAGAGVDIIKLLFNRGCSFNDCMEHCSPMLCVTDRCSGALLKAEVLTLLLKMGASLEEVDSNGCTALQRSLKYRVYEVDAIKILLDYARMNEELSNIKHGELGNLLHFALSNPRCKLSIANLLLMNGVRCDEQNVYGRTPLHEAMGGRTRLCIVSTRLCIVSTLLRSGSPVNRKCNYGDTPLMLAVALHSPVNVIFALMAAGAFIEGLTDNKGAPLLEHVLKEYRRFGIDTCKKVIKFALIENPNCQIEGLLESHSDKEELTGFAEEYRIDFKKLKSVNIGQVTSIEFIKGYYSRNVAGDCKTTLHLQLDQLLKAISESPFYNFYDVICYKISSLLLMEKLDQLSVYTMKNCCDNPCVEHKIKLNSECKVRIVRYVSRRDLMCFVLAFLFHQ